MWFMKMGMLSMIFPNCLSHIVFFFLLAENNLLAGVSKGKCYPNCYVTFRTGKIISLGVLSLCMCVHMHVWFTSESQLVVHTQNQLLQWMSIWFPAFPSLVLKNHSFWIGQCVCSPIFTSCHLWDLGACEKVWGHYW